VAESTSVNFKLRNDLNELFNDVAHLMQIPKVNLFNSAIDFYLKKIIKENYLEDDLKFLKEGREKREKRKKESK
jgi:hypothetical protein